MEVFVGGRRTGKTHRMVEWVKQGRMIDQYPGWNRIILTSTLDEAQRLRHDFDLDYRQVFSLLEWKNGHIPHRNAIALGIDNVDMLLFHILGGPIDAMSLTGEEVDLGEDELVSAKEIALRLGMSKSGVSKWTRNREHFKFPEPKGTMGKHDLYSLREVTTWWEKWQQVRQGGGFVAKAYMT